MGRILGSGPKLALGPEKTQGRCSLFVAVLPRLGVLAAAGESSKLLHDALGGSLLFLRWLIFLILGVILAVLLAFPPGRFLWLRSFLGLLLRVVSSSLVVLPLLSLVLALVRLEFIQEGRPQYRYIDSARQSRMSCEGRRDSQETDLPSEAQCDLVVVRIGVLVALPNLLHEELFEKIRMLLGMTHADVRHLCKNTS